MEYSENEQKQLKVFGEKLRALRESKGWTLEKTEEMGWPSWQHLQKIESGQKNITLLTILRIEELYKIKILEL